MILLYNLTGQVFGRLTVLERDTSKQGTYWFCRCNCKDKTIKSIASSSLMSKRTKSCGCLKKENKLSKKYNTYNLSGEYGIGYTFKGEEFYFDSEDYDKIKKHCWYKAKESGYIVTRDTETKKIIRMHRLIMNITNRKIQVDHILHINHDNRKIELRVVNNTENQMNRTPMKNTKSGVKGVYLNKKKNLWVASISVYGKRIHLGCSKDLNKAIVLRKDAEDKYWGKYSYDNSMKSKDNNMQEELNKFSI